MLLIRMLVDLRKAARAPLAQHRAARRFRPQSWEHCFIPGSTWRFLAFSDPARADTVVLLAEDHDEFWRDGYVLDGVRLCTESGPLRPGPGSPFLRDDGDGRFTT